MENHLFLITQAFPFGLVRFLREESFYFSPGGRMAFVVEQGISLVANILVANWRKGVTDPSISM